MLYLNTLMNWYDWIHENRKQQIKKIKWIVGGLDRHYECIEYMYIWSMLYTGFFAPTSATLLGLAELLRIQMLYMA